MNKRIFIVFFVSLIMFTGCAKDEYGKSIDTKDSLQSAEYTENYKLYIYLRNSSGYEVASKYLQPLLVETEISDAVLINIKNQLKLDQIKLKELNKDYIENYYKKIEKEYKKDNTNDEFSKINIMDSVKQIDGNIATINQIYNLIESDVKFAEDNIINSEEYKKINEDQLKIIQLNEKMLNIK